MEYDVIIIGAGLSGLSAASLLAKRGLKVAVVEHADKPGGSCGVFKRGDTVFDQGAAMLYGFGERGFNAHRFLFNCLEEPFTVVKHNLLYVVHYRGKSIRFWPDTDRFIIELSDAFPDQKKQIHNFYTDMKRMYTHVISENPVYVTPDETDPLKSLLKIFRHPVSYMRFLSYMNISAEKLLKHYFTSDELLQFFDKLTSTYCYATISEAPAIMASIMFIDNHEGGSYYPAGSTLFLTGTLEKVIEENEGTMLYESTVKEILFSDHIPKGVALEDGTAIYGKHIIYSGTVWNLYDRLLPPSERADKEMQWANSQIPTYPSVVLYSLVEKSAIPEGTCPIEMIAANPEAIDESEVTIYILSLDDHTLCPSDLQTVIAIGPSFKSWSEYHTPKYELQKEEEAARLIGILENRFPGFSSKMLHYELATPATIESYTMKNGGSVAGPKQMLGQHLLRRQTTKTRWNNLFCCGESTVMGTGTPTVTTSGISAANAVLKNMNLDNYVWNAKMQNYVNVVQPPVEKNWIRKMYPCYDALMMEQAGRCLFCNNPKCCQKDILDIPGILRRVACGNFVGAKGIMDKCFTPLTDEFIRECQQRCVQFDSHGSKVEIEYVLKELNFLKRKNTIASIRVVSKL